MGLLSIIGILLRLLQLLILARVIISYVPAWRRSAPGQLVESLTEPMLAPVRRMIHGSTMMRATSFGLDFSPVILLVIIVAISRILGV